MMKKEAVLIVIIIVALIAGFVFIDGKHNSSKSIGDASSQNSTAKNSTALKSSEENISNASQASEIALTVSTPADGATVTSSTITLTGHTAPLADIFVNDQVGRADAAGAFSFEITLDPGQNEILVDANDKNGNAAERDITVIYNAPQ
jgi:cytoskeletal protein RodZ